MLIKDLCFSGFRCYVTVCKSTHYSNMQLLLQTFFFFQFQLPHRALHHLFKLVGGHAQRLVDVAQRPFHDGLVSRFADDQALSINNFRYSIGS